MKNGVHAETSIDRLQNRLRGVGSLMLREQFPADVRLHVARAFHSMLCNPALDGVDVGVVFSAFFVKGELSDKYTRMPLQQGEVK